MQKDRTRWNQKYLKKEYPTEVSAVVARFIELAPKGRALDIAAGNGRNALFLARQGFKVDAVDISDVGLKEFSGLHPHVHPVCADLDLFRVSKARYSLIININFLDRRLVPAICEGLIRGGVLIFETLRMGSQKEEGPYNKDHLLRENELLHLFLSLKVLFYEETEKNRKNHRDCMSSLVAQKP